MNNPITRDQREQIECAIVVAAKIGALKALSEVLLDEEGAQRVLSREGILRTEIGQTIFSALNKLNSPYPILTETPLLKPVAEAIIPERTKPFDITKFYQTRDGIHIYDTFAEHFDLSARQTVDSAPKRPYVALLLKADATNKAIKKELPETQISTLEDIAHFIQTQPNGEPGFLLMNNVDENVFYVKNENSEVFAVNVSWYSGNGVWGIDNWEPDEDILWNSGTRIICPGNAML